jgi:16S rRNA G1207 methylase RsmC
VVQEFGWDDDVDDDLRALIEETTGNDLVDEDYDDVADAVLVWWRADDGDLADQLVDALTVLDDGGAIWVFTRKAGRRGHVGHDEIEEAATTAGLHAMSTFAVADDWSATRLANRGRGR